MSNTYKAIIGVQCLFDATGAIPAGTSARLRYFMNSNPGCTDVMLYGMDLRDSESVKAWQSKIDLAALILGRPITKVITLEDVVEACEAMYDECGWRTPSGRLDVDRVANGRRYNAITDFIVWYTPIADDPERYVVIDGNFCNRTFIDHDIAVQIDYIDINNIDLPPETH